MRPARPLFVLALVGAVAAGVLFALAGGLGPSASSGAATRGGGEDAPLGLARVGPDGVAPHLEGAPPADASAPPPEASPAARALTGVVRDREDHPIAGARVLAFAAPAAATTSFGAVWEELDGLALPEATPTPLARATSDSGGRFRLEGLPEGALLLEAGAPGYLRSETRAGAPGRTPQDVTLVLAPAESLAGVVVDEAGTPVAGALVRGSWGALFGERGSDQIVADERGRFRLSAWPARSLVLLVRAPGHPVAALEVPPGERDVRVVLASEAVIRARVVRVDLAGGEAPLDGARIAVAVLGAREEDAAALAWAVTDERGEATLVVQAGTLAGAMVHHPRHPEGFVFQSRDSIVVMGDGQDLLPEDRRVGPGETQVTFRVASGFDLAGRVTAEDGAPVAAAVVRAFLPWRTVDTTTDADGRYRLAVPLGSWWERLDVEVEAKGLAQPPESARVLRPTPPVSPIVHDVVLRPEALVEGRVLLDDGTPAEGVLVSIVLPGDVPPPFDSAVIEERLPMPRTGPDGRFRLDGVWAVPGLRVSAWTKGYVPTTTPPFDVEPGRTERVGDLRLLRGVQLRVRVVDGAGTAVPDAVLGLWRAGEGDDDSERFQADDARGTIETRPLRPGVLFLAVESPAHPTVHRRVVLAGDGSVQELEVRLAAGATVAGRVLEAPGKPSSDHPYVRIGDRAVYADEEGRFRVTGIAPGPVVVRVFSSHRAMQVVRLEAPREDVEILLEAPVPDGARRSQDLDRRWKETDAQRARTDDPEEHARLVETLEDLILERRFVEPEAPLPGGSACGGAACG